MISQNLQQTECFVKVERESTIPECSPPSTLVCVSNYKALEEKRAKICQQCIVTERNSVEGGFTHWTLGQWTCSSSVIKIHTLLFSNDLVQHGILDTRLSKSKENILPIGENIGNIEQPPIQWWRQTSMLISAPKFLQRADSQASPFQSDFIKLNYFEHCAFCKNYKRGIAARGRR